MDSRYNCSYIQIYSFIDHYGMQIADKGCSLVSYNWEVISRLEKIPIMPLASNPPVRETHRK